MSLNIVSGKGMLLDSIDPSPESMLAYHQRCVVALTGNNFTRIIHKLNAYHACGNHKFKITVTSLRSQWVNILRSRQNGRHFADDIFKYIFLNENACISLKISLKFVPRGPINNIPSLVQIMAWRRPGDKPLSEPMMIILLTHICVTRPQWVNSRKRSPEDGSFLGTKVQIIVTLEVIRC